jgi:gas vesicle protein
MASKFGGISITNSSQDNTSFKSKFGGVIASPKEEKLTEESIKTNPTWVKASKSIYKFNEGDDAPDLDSDEQYANYGLRYMGNFNYNLPKMGYEAAQLNNATDQQKKDFVTLMDMYDEKEASLAGFGRAIKGLALDPSTYLGIGTFGAVTAGAQAVKAGIKAGVKEATKAGLKQGAKVGAIEGATYTAADNALRQTARINAGAQESFDLGQTAKAAALGATVGGSLGGAVGTAGGFVSAGGKLTNPFKKKLNEAVEVEEEKLIDTESTIADVKKDIEQRTKEFSEEAARESQKLFGEITDSVQPSLTTGLTKEALDIGTKFLTRLGVPTNPDLKVSDQIFDALSLIKTDEKAGLEFASLLKEINKTPEDFANMLRLDVREGARKMNLYSQVSKNLKDLGARVSDLAPEDPLSDSLARKFSKGTQALDNVRRGLLVSQIATTARNFTAQIGRVGMHTLTDVIDNTLNTTFNPVRRLFGAETKPVDYSQSLSLFTNLTKDTKFAKEATEFITKYFVNEKDRLFTSYASDVADASKSKIFKGAQKVVDGLNFFNRQQEYFYRRGMFASSLDNTLRNKGTTLKEVVETGNLKNLSQEDVAKAVDDALEFTYAKTPDNFFAKTFVDVTNKLPFALTALIPFPRFMANAIQFQFRYSPLGFTSLLMPSEIKKIAKGDMKTLSRAMLGTGLLLGAVEAKRKGFGGERWYELKTEDGKTVDARPYFPLTPYLLVADFIVRAESGRRLPETKEIIQGLTGAQFRAGAGLRLVDDFANGLAGVDTEAKVSRQVTNFVSDVLSGYLTPFRMFNDFLDQQQEFRRAVPESQTFADIPENIAEQLKGSIPFLREELPESVSPTRAAAPGRPETVRVPGTEIEVPGPLARQLTGITVREAKNLAEKEFDRLGFKRRDIIPYTGSQKADNILAKYMGRMIEYYVPGIVESEFYKQLNNPQKEIFLKEELKKMRSTARAYAYGENKELFDKIKFRRKLTRPERLLIERQFPGALRE